MTPTPMDVARVAKAANAACDLVEDLLADASPEMKCALAMVVNATIGFYETPDADGQEVLCRFYDDPVEAIANLP